MCIIHTFHLLAFNQRRKSSDRNSHGEGRVVKGNRELGRNWYLAELGRNKSRSKSRRRRKHIQCFQCKKKGHIKRECLDLKSGNSKNKGALTKYANFVEEEGLDNYDSNMLSVIYNTNHREADMDVNITKSIILGLDL